MPVPPRQTVKAAGKRRAQSASSALAREIVSRFESRRSPEQAAHLGRFFKTGPGQYGEGDCFLGLKVPATRSLIKPYSERLSLDDCGALLESGWHEIRLAALMVLGWRSEALARAGDQAGLRKLVSLYDQRLERANNWDLVDLSACEIMEPYWRCLAPPAQEIRRFLAAWADSGNLWRERAAMVSTHARQRQGSLAETFWLAERFLDHPHDLMHKACGWMLREAGKRDLAALRSFLAAFHQRLPRTTLRYAIERLDEKERQRWLKK
ncbi:MAG: DNA alkylation repair protein [Planctomycetota bacterium]|jgi:3-methyladenine DNA glycosylase AlkD|nr:DNA alkylation repair protein [Planctomycetota bacterium]